MSKWEEESIIIDQTEDLVVYRGYIDDIFINWRGDHGQLISFFQKRNTNHKNIVLTWQIEENTIPFLDLEISRTNKKIVHKDVFQKCSPQ